MDTSQIYILFPVTYRSVCNRRVTNHKLHTNASMVTAICPAEVPRAKLWVFNNSEGAGLYFAVYTDLPIEEVGEKFFFQGSIEKSQQILQ